MSKNIDLEIIDDLVKRCEKTMVSPFSKKKEEEVKSGKKDRKGRIAQSDAELLASMYSEIEG